MWTLNQQTAIDAPVADNLVSAAAGSGKTAVMVERIVSRVVSGLVNIDRLLVVTYTNAAASELKSRLMQKIMEQLDTAENTDNLNRQLMLINNASICTIHSFCLEVIRNNFHRIGLDPGFKIADTGETELAKREILDKIFDSYYDSNDSEFLNLVDCYTTKNDSSLMNIILNMYDFCMNTPGGVDFMAEKAREFVCDDKWIQHITDIAFEEAREAVALYDEAIELCDFDENLIKAKEILINERDMFKNLLRSKSWDESCRAMNCFVFERLVLSKKADAQDRERISYLRSQAKDVYKRLCETAFTDTLENIKSDINKTAPSVNKLVEIMTCFHEEFTLYKRGKNMVDFVDLEHLALGLLQNDDGSPSDTAKGYEERFEEIYVDEYQDCNSVQEAIFSCISRKNLGSPNMFMVGDMKQSIYRFRGSEPALFKHKADSYANFGEGDGAYNKIILNKNFRSRDTVLNAVNSIFRQLMNNGCGELEYTQDEYLYYNEGSYEDVNADTNTVDVVAIDEKGRVNEDIADDSDFSEELKGIEAEAIYVANRINKMISDGGYTVFDNSLKTYRQVRYSDIVILLRSVKGYAEVFSDILTTAQIPVYCDVGSGYYDTPEISFLINFLKIIDNPFNDIALLSVMRHPVYNFTDDDFVTVRMAERDGYFYNSVLKYIEENKDSLSEKLKDFTKELKYFFERSKYLPADKLIWEITEKTDYMSYLSFLPNPELKKANVRALFNRAYDFEQTEYKGIFNFIKYIDSLKKSKNDADTAQTLGDGENVVRIMSIHKSKGLEFPIVFLCRSTKNFNTRDITDRILLHKDYGIGVNFIDSKSRLSYPLPVKNLIKEKLLSEAISEEMRVLYVALTRAREKLIITGSVKNAQKHISDTALKLMTCGEKISPWISKKAKSYFDWILMAVMRNKTCNFTNSFCFEKIIDDGSRFSFTLIPKDELVFEVDEGTDKFDFDELAPLSGCDEFVKSRLEYKYPYAYLASVPANMSVTELKRMDNGDNDVYSFFKQNKLITPKFLSGIDKPSAADIGIYTHLVMEKLSFDKISSVDDVKSQVDALGAKGFLNNNSAKYINCENIYRLFDTPLGKKMKENYSSLKREYSFKYLMNASEIYPDAEENEKIVVQGMIDAYFEDENGDIIIVDYKTDRVSDNINDIVTKYKPQLKYYQTAVEKALGKKVSSKYLFLLDSGDAVEVKD